MFKVSLLPESYRKKLIGKKNKDIILSVAAIVLMCMLIVYAGVAVRLLVLKGEEKQANRDSAAILAQIDELSPYVEDYNGLEIAKANYENIKPVDITALEMVNYLQKITPDYVHITAIYAPDWQQNQVCVIEGDLSSANSLGVATNQLNAYKSLIENNKDLKDSIREVYVVNGQPLTNEGTQGAETTFSFRIIVSLSGSINIDEQTGTLMTHTTTETSAPATTEPITDAPETTVEASTIA